MSAPGRAPGRAVVAVVAGAALCWVSAVLLMAGRGILSPGPFGNRLAASLGDERVAAYVAARATDGIIEQRPNLVAVRPVLEAAVKGLVRSDAFRAAVRTSGTAAHRLMFQASGQKVMVVLPDLSILLKGVLEQASPKLAAQVPATIRTALASDRVSQALTRFLQGWRLAGRLLDVLWGLFALGLLLLVVGVVADPDRRRGLVHAGAGLGAVAVLLLALIPLGTLVGIGLSPDPAVRGAIAGLWVSYFGPVKDLAAIFGIGALVLASAGGSLLEAGDPTAVARRAWAWLVQPGERRTMQVGRALVLLGLGGLALAAPDRALDLLAILVGAALVYLGLRGVFAVILGTARLDSGAVPVHPTLQRGRLVRVVVAVAGAAALVLGAVALFVVQDRQRADTVVAAPTTCNGSRVLCGRRLSEVVIAAAHNAMSNAEVPGWLFPHHGHGIPRMLEDGIRGLLVDVHYGIPVGQRVKTDLDREGSSREKIEGAVGPEGTAAALRIRDELVGQAEGTPGLYFCHGFCELGAYPVGPTLERIRDFLVLHPGEVVVMVVEDYVAPEDLGRAFEAAGLAQLAFKGPVGPVLPTLGELVASNQRLVVFLESGKPGVPWMFPAFTSVQETPYTFHAPAEFSCRPNRGADGPLFMINHWIETTPAPRPTNAQVVNAYDFLLLRARRCEAERQHLPNVLAVDFYDVGDVVRVAATLNGLDSAGTTPKTGN